MLPVQGQSQATEFVQINVHRNELRRIISGINNREMPFPYITENSF